MNKKYEQILGVSENANINEVYDAANKLHKEIMPSVDAGDEWAINAYEELKEAVAYFEKKLNKKEKKKAKINKKALAVILAGGIVIYGTTDGICKLIINSKNDSLSTTGTASGSVEEEIIEEEPLILNVDNFETEVDSLYNSLQASGIGIDRDAVYSALLVTNMNGNVTGDETYVDGVLSTDDVRTLLGETDIVLHLERALALNSAVVSHNAREGKDNFSKLSMFSYDKEDRAILEALEQNFLNLHEATKVGDYTKEEFRTELYKLLDFGNGNGVYETKEGLLSRDTLTGGPGLIMEEYQRGIIAKIQTEGVYGTVEVEIDGVMKETTELVNFLTEEDFINMYTFINGSTVTHLDGTVETMPGTNGAKWLPDIINIAATCSYDTTQLYVDGNTYTITSPMIKK